MSERTITNLKSLETMVAAQYKDAIKEAIKAVEEKDAAEKRPTVLAVKGLRKMQPKKVVRQNWGANICPECGFQFQPYQYNDKWCSKCGQRLEWG